MSVKYIKIKALNSETGAFQQKLLQLTSEIQKDCLLGRHPSCDLVLNSPEVSRIHGRISCQDGQCFYTDLGSTDGSQIDEQEVEINQAYLLKPDSLLRIGGFVLTFAQLNSNQSTIEMQTSGEQTDISLNQPRQWNSGKLTVRCIQAIAETDDVKTFRFVADPPVLFSYKPGQFVTLDLEIEGKRVMRSYSISSTPSRPHTLEITVKRVPPPTDVAAVPPGLVSNWLHDHITVGSQVKITGPMGKFTCVDNSARKLLFISAGSGITPMMSMSRWLCDTGANADLVFIYSVRSRDDFIFRHELEAMAVRYKNFKLAVTMTGLQPGQAWSGYTGRLNQLMLQAIAPDLWERTVYVCGSNPFMAEVKSILKTLDFPMEFYYEESFGGRKSKPTIDEATQTKAKVVSSSGQDQEYRQKIASVPDNQLSTPEVVSSIQATEVRSPVVVFAESGKAIACDSEDIILEIAEQEGIELPSGCRMGVCGVCKLPLLEGEVSYDDDPGCELGHLLPCIAKPIGQVVIKA